MADVSRYLLTFLFDASHITPHDLEQRARAVLQKHLPSVGLQVESIDARRVQLSIVGSLEDVDACHDKLNEELFDRHSCFRVLDEAGDEIRQEAYPILAQIEQQLRTFINRAMTEVIGFDWWDSMTPPAIRRTVEEIEKKAGQLSAMHHPLEFAYFDQLVSMVTGSVQEWTGDRPLSVADLTGLLSHCRSMEEVHTELAGKTRRVSLWDEVFGRYFEQAHEWSNLHKRITGFVIPARNKVMHHRPIRLYELQELSHIRESVRTLLSSAKEELSHKERMEARQISMGWIDVMRRQQAEWAQVHQSFSDALLEPGRRQQEQFAQAQQAFSDALLEPGRRQQEQFAQAQQAFSDAMLEPGRRQREQWAATLQAVLEPIRKLQQQMAPTTERLVEPPTSEADLGEQGSAMTYRVYENWSARPDKAIIHRSDCPYANGGPIRSPTKNGQWHGPFAMYQEALEAAERTGREEVRGCMHCNPP